MPYVPQLRRWEDRCAERRAELDAEVARVRGFFATQPDVVAVYAFGSYASGKIGPTSDLDLLVVSTDAGRKLDIEDRLRVQGRFRVRVDFVIVTPAEYAERLPTTSFGRTILETAVELYRAS